MDDRPRVRKGQTDVKLDRAQFSARSRERFSDPLFEDAGGEVAALEARAWRAYDEYHKSPRTRRTGPGVAAPEPLPK